MRAVDQPMPLDYVLPDHTPLTEIGQRLVILLERLPVAAYMWDDEDDAVVYDHASPDTYVYDAPFIGGGFTDVVCDWISLEIGSGRPDDDGLVESGECTLTLANPDGRYSLLDSSGRVVYAAIGRRLQIFGDADGSYWWLFGGRITNWDLNADNTVTIKAFDGFNRLADEVPEWTPGTNDQIARDRITSILTRWGYTDPTRLAITDVRMGAPVTDRSPLEEIQTTALSDGGVFFGDADGALVYLGRDFYTGRPDQTRTWTISDNLCGGEIISVWDLEFLAGDEGLASKVELQNYAMPTALVATASKTPAPWDVPITRSHPDKDLWNYQADGNRLATDLLARWSNDAARFAFNLYLHTPVQDIWRMGMDLRLGDKINVVREYPAADGGDVMDVDAIAVTIEHQITPDEWLVHVETHRVVAFRQSQRWDYAVDTYDDATATNVWSY